MSECGPLIDDFRAEMLMAFDVLSAGLCAVLPNSLNNLLDNVQKDREYIYIGADGKGPTFVPRLEMGAPIVSVGREWAEISAGLLDQVVEKARPLIELGDRAITAPARWLTAARREPDDPFRRFMFAFFGLEMLAAKFYKADGKRTVKGIESTVNIPLTELFWPLPDDESRDPWRRTMFKFAIMAVALSDRAREDIDSFRPLMKSRNEIAHGSNVDIQTLPATEAEALFGRYLGLVFQSMNEAATSR
ncbi:hypothetical protein AL755_13655 [Arthrobacter sp. ERGS1:01]|uniref:hypothetical protein n=1 Tax=Arthrobacter sp. ERGS1:01 TaxID=1704044 RepID=UPI0006B6952F|nr:hypothetical protein [Arthrobacter sp. ERGS1:01]ALE06262.1 hypothetical protein AL755_13655 [Arthrobacter sp. ERGS1:01]